MSSLRRKYTSHRIGAKARGIDFLLTFKEWLSIWESSGKLEQRGRCRGNYVMARNGDVGPYSIDNVTIKTVVENGVEGNAGKVVSKKTRDMISASLSGRVFKDETRAKLSAAGKTKVFTAKHRENKSKAALGERNPFYGKTHSEETRQKLREAALRQHSRKQA